MATVVVVSSVSRQEVAKRRAEREAEIERLGMKLSLARGRSDKLSIAAELLAFLGFIHNTPEARCRWENQ